MKPSVVNCNLCESRHVVKSAEAWCSMCKKGFCNKCRYSHLSSRKNRGHKFISVEKYHKEGSPESLICKEHENKSHYFCPKHNEVVCVVCHPDAHEGCDGLATLHEASKAMKLSTVTADFSKNIKSVSGNIQKAISNRSKNLTNLKEQKKKIEEEIGVIRNHINEQLNRVQEELFHEVSKTYQKQKNDIEECLKTLEGSSKELQSLKEQSEEIKDATTTNIQNFLRTMQIRKKIKQEETSVIDTIKGNKPISLVFKPTAAAQNLYDEGMKFGTIEVQLKTQVGNKKSTNSENHTKTRNGPRPVSKSHAKLQVVHKCNVKKSFENHDYIKSCAFKSDGQILFIEPENKLVVIYDKKCDFVTSISVPGHPFDIASINYCTAALTFEKINHIQIMDTTFNKISKTIHTKNPCRGISYMNGQIYVVVKGEGILILDTLGQIKKSLRINVSHVRFLCASNSRLCFTDEESREIHCCDLRGKEIWKFQDKTVENPQAITMDAFGNVYVLNIPENETSTEPSYSVIAISSDGNTSKVVLKRNGRPSGIDFDKKHKKMVLYDLDGSAELYDVL